MSFPVRHLALAAAVLLTLTPAAGPKALRAAEPLAAGPAAWTGDLAGRANRVEENRSEGTDHGTATPMFIIGKGAKAGFYGTHPSLTDLDDGNMKMTTDFRRVYATMIREWLGCDEAEAILKGRFEPLGVFA